MAVIDVVIFVGLIALAMLGTRDGFIRGALSFVSTFVSIIIAIALARPLASLLDSWFGFSEPLSNVFDGSALENIAQNSGFLFLTIICGVSLFVLTKVIVYFLKRLSLRITDSSKLLNVVDRALGTIFGLFRFGLWLLFLSGAIFVLSQISLTAGIHTWLFENSSVGLWVYDRMIEWFVIPIFSSVGAGGIIN